jgi:glycolate oxidase iron-sulfur subunit
MKNDKNDAGSCVKCGTCNTVCPVYLATGNEIHTPRGRQHLNARMNRSGVSSHFADIFSKCLLCGACRDVCPRGLDTPQLVIGVRAELPRLTGLSFLKYISRRALVHPSLLSGLTMAGTAAAALLGPWLPPDSGLRLRLQGFSGGTFNVPASGYIEKLKKETAAGNEPQEDGAAPGIAFFSGCLANYLQPEIAESTQLLVARATGHQAGVPLAQTCCGMAALAAGRIDEARALAKKNIMAFGDNDNPVLTSCSSCYYQLKSYEDLLGDDPEWRERAANFSARLKEFSSFFLEKFSAENELFLPADTATGNKVTYHDPCHLRFKLHITQEPRQLIGLLPGVALQELPGGPRCCGQGGLFQVAHPDLALKVRDKLIHDFAGAGAETVLTACSGCLLQWQFGLAAENKGPRAMHLAVFMAGRLQ